MGYRLFAKKCAILCLAVLAIISSIGKAKAHDFLPDEYEEIRNLALKIQELCPPYQCLYVGIGRSPAAIMAFLQELSSDSAVNFAGSHLNEFFIETPGSADNLKTHIERITNDPRAQGRTLVPIDLVNTGESLEFVTTELSKNCALCRVKPIGLVTTLQSGSGAVRILRRGGEIIQLDQNFPLLADMFVYELKHKALSEFGEVDIARVPAAELKSRQEYQELRDSLRSKIKNDPILRGFQTALPPAVPRADCVRNLVRSRIQIGD